MGRGGSRAYFLMHILIEMAKIRSLTLVKKKKKSLNAMINLPSKAVQKVTSENKSRYLWR